MIKSILISLLILLSLFGRGQQATVDVIMKKMEKSIFSLKSAAYLMNNTERINGQMLSGEQFIKWSADPHKVYVFMKKPNPGAELIYFHGKNSNQATYDPNGFPYFKMHLDPMGSLMRNKNHHTLYEAGFRYVYSLLEHGYKNTSAVFTYQGEVDFKGRTCHKILVQNNSFGFEKYVVKKGENVLTIAKKNFISEYMILERNKDIKDYYSVSEGQEIVIPNSYGKVITVYVDKVHFIPVFLKVEDDRGDFEKYEYTELIVNPTIPEEQFTESYLDR